MISAGLNETGTSILYPLTTPLSQLCLLFSHFFFSDNIKPGAKELLTPSRQQNCCYQNLYCKKNIGFMLSLQHPRHWCLYKCAAKIGALLKTLSKKMSHTP